MKKDIFLLYYIYILSQPEKNAEGQKQKAF